MVGWETKGVGWGVVEAMGMGELQRKSQAYGIYISRKCQEAVCVLQAVG